MSVQMMNKEDLKESFTKEIMLKWFLDRTDNIFGMDICREDIANLGVNDIYNIVVIKILNGEVKYPKVSKDSLEILLCKYAKDMTYKEISGKYGLSNRAPKKEVEKCTMAAKLLISEEIQRRKEEAIQDKEEEQ